MATEYSGYYKIPNIESRSFPLDIFPSNILFGTALFTLTIIVFYNTAFSSKWPSILRLLGKYSFGIYLIHYFFLETLILLLRRASITPNNGIFYLILFPGTVAFSLGMAWLLWRLPFSSVIFGHRVLRVESK